ncbi:MAG: helix-turn-helix transcriptional regulator [Nevskia sp.]|nr:helix-turn-helix transcriptional regulator [Nevskia sp.]
MDALPFLPHVRIKGKQPKPKPYVESPQTIGEHLKRARLLRGLTQAQMAKMMGVNAFTIVNWEKARTAPSVPFAPAIRRFLGYDPYPEPRTLPERMFAKRRSMGWTLTQAAYQFGVDVGTWGCWERGFVIPWPRYQRILEQFLN